MSALPLKADRCFVLTLFSKKRHLKSGVGLQPAGITPRVLKSPHVKSQLQEKQHEETSDYLGRADCHRDARISPVV